MRFLLTLLLLISLAFIPLSVSASGSGTGAHGPTVHGETLINSLDELAERFDTTVCADCHEEIYEDWTHSGHGRAFSTERVLQTWRTFIKQGLEKEDHLDKMAIKSHCLWCHAPHIKYATDELVSEIIGMIITAVDDPDESKREATKKELSKLNLNCYGCHNMFALKDGYWGNKPEKLAIYGPRGEQDPEELAHEVETNLGTITKTIKSEYLTSPQFCARCHHGCPDSVPFWQCQTLYTSYMENYVDKGGDKRCQDCHMKREDDDPDNPRRHTFPGVHDKDFFADALEIEIEAETTQYINNYKNELTPTLCLNVKMTSHSGHGLPNG
jgi:hypothetical protein